MPNHMNARAPVTLLGLGRSGTTLLSETFGAHSDFQNCSETGGLIFGVWQGAQESFMPLEPRDWHLADDPMEKAAYYVRQTLVATCPSDRPRWFQKPAGLPISYIDLDTLPGQRGPVTGFPVEWYWHVMRASFPDGSFLTVLRNPFDIALSRMEHTGWNPGDVLTIAARYMEIFNYGRDHFDLVMNFEDLVESYGPTVERACLACGCRFEPAMLSAKAINHAPAGQRGPRADHRAAWRRLEGLEVPAAYITLFEQTWSSLGWDLAVPDRLKRVH